MAFAISSSKLALSGTCASSRLRACRGSRLGGSVAEVKSER